MTLRAWIGFKLNPNGKSQVNDAERLSVDPAMWHVVDGRAALTDKQAASTSEVGRFETEILSSKANTKKLMDLFGQWIDRVHERKPPKKLILDRIERLALPPPVVARCSE